MFNSELEIGKQVKVGDFVKGDRIGTIVELTDKYEIPSNGVEPEINADRWVIVEFSDKSRKGHMAGMLEEMVTERDVDTSAVRRLGISIRGLLDATKDEKETLLEILDQEGFGGRENEARSEADCDALAEERLEWLRQQRKEGVR